MESESKFMNIQFHGLVYILVLCLVSTFQDLEIPLLSNRTLPEAGHLSVTQWGFAPLGMGKRMLAFVIGSKKVCLEVGIKNKPFSTTSAVCSGFKGMFRLVV
jgi:hypothetical protein